MSIMPQVVLPSTKEIIIGKGYTILMPNAFSPNGDNINEIIGPVFTGLKAVEYHIYNSQGILVYQEFVSEDNLSPNGTIEIMGWDGETRTHHPISIYIKLLVQESMRNCNVKHRNNIFNRMMKVKIVHISLFLLFANLSAFAQERFISSSRNMQFINPSYHGINMVSKAGVYYSQFNFGDGTSYIDNKYLYGNFAFEDMNFSIGLM